MKKTYKIAILCTLIITILFHGTIKVAESLSKRKEHITVGFLYVGDRCNTYTNNFARAQDAIEAEFGDAVTTTCKFNVSEGEEEQYLKELVEEGCDLIFSTSYGYGKTTKEFAQMYPDVQFCMATCSNANEAPVLDNFHNYMGEIYQGRYISGVVAGMKMQEMIKTKVITEKEAKVGYVGAFPYAEVISGYTAFLMGVRSVVPSATMDVVYTNSWGDYSLEKEYATKLIENGAVIISQHSDTVGPATACEELSDRYSVYHVGYNQSMADIAPTTSLISSRINWLPYMVQATDAVLKGKSIETNVDCNIYGKDASGGIKEGWVQMLRLNETVAARDTQKEIDRLEKEFKEGKIQVFKGDYVGVDPFDKEDTIDLKRGYQENETSSAPSFHYVLQDVITIRDDL